jgi:phospholipid-transporting ATPase
MENVQPDIDETVLSSKITIRFGSDVPLY